MNGFFCFLAGFSAAVIASMGIGGGAVLILFLTLFSDLALRTAQGVNLLFFLPVALIALFFHGKNGLLCTKKAVIYGLLGIPGIFAGFWLGSFLDSRLLGKGFAVFLLALGLRSLFAKDRKKEPKA